MYRDTWKPATGEPADWRSQAACREIGHAPFFPEGQVWGPSEYGPALRICKACPVQAECLEFALENDERYGIWGGTLPPERARMKGKKRW